MIDQPYSTPPEYARVLRSKPETVIEFIKRGELFAVNVGTKSRPRYRIPPDAIREFEMRRSGKQLEKPTRRKRKDPQLIEFY